MNNHKNNCDNFKSPTTESKTHGNMILCEGTSTVFWDELFDWLYSLTMEIYMLDAHKFRCSKGYIKRWSDLADIWGDCAASRREHNVFDLAIHKIHWNVYPVDFPENIPTVMIDEVQKLLQQNCEAFTGWKRNQYYRNAFDNVLMQCRPIGKHAPAKRLQSYTRFICNRTWLYVVYKQNPPPTIDLAHYTRAEFVAAKKHATIFAEFHAYETVIVRLIPEAATWSESQWCDERLLYKLFQKKYGTDIKNQAAEIDKVIAFLMHLWYFKSLSIWHLLRIEYLPDALMEAIWPVNTKHEVTRLLCVAYSRVKCANTYLGKWRQKPLHCSWDLFQKSWLLKRSREWVEQKDLTDAMPKTKEIVFLVDSGIAQQISNHPLLTA